MMQTLGKFVWEALQSDVRQLLINKAALEKECPDIMKLGLLHVVGVRKATARKQPAYLSYEHKSLQEFGASKFITERLETAENIKETLKELFPSWKAVQRYREVVIFGAGLMKDSRPLVQHVYEMWVENYLNKKRAVGGCVYEVNIEYYLDVSMGYLSRPIDADLFQSLQAESSVRLVDHPLHNKYINYYDHVEDMREKRPFNTTVYFPSQLYHFYQMKHEVVLENHLTLGEEIPPCAMYIYSPDKAVSDSFLSICSQISLYQAVSDLFMWRVTCNSLTPPILIKPVTVLLTQCNFPDGFLEKILHQLKGCGESLQELVLQFINLAPFESLLDELLEDLVAHHEAGLTQRKLKVVLGGDRRDPTNLSKGFVKKWQNRRG